ncbi:MAG: helix-turn-helix domain-containing protein [Limisphaerales bacterium]
MTVTNGLLDDDGAAKFLGLTPRTIRLYRQQRGLPFLRLSSKIIRFREVDLEDWAVRQRVQIRAR